MRNTKIEELSFQPKPHQNEQMIIKEGDNAETHNLCLSSKDPYLDEKTVWVAELDDGTKVYCDDGRGSPVIAWQRLKNYSDQNNRKISSLTLKFRSHEVSMIIDEYDQVGVVNSVLFVYPHFQKDSFNVVREKRGECDVTQYIIPELEIFKTNTRPSDSYEKILIPIHKNG